MNKSLPTAFVGFLWFIAGEVDEIDWFGAAEEVEGGEKYEKSGANYD